jgi:hypothetical protein
MLAQYLISVYYVCQVGVKGITTFGFSKVVSAELSVECAKANHVEALTISHH